MSVEEQKTGQKKVRRWGIKKVGACFIEGRKGRIGQPHGFFGSPAPRHQECKATVGPILAHHRLAAPAHNVSLATSALPPKHRRDRERK